MCQFGVFFKLKQSFLTVPQNDLFGFTKENVVKKNTNTKTSD